MIWFTWRQFRTQTWLTVAALAAVGAVLAITGRGIADLYTASGIIGCRTDCGTLTDAFLRQATEGTNGQLYHLGNVMLHVIPPILGVFWGAPLIARELETGTHRLAWNQSVTRTRWLAIKLGIIGLACVATTGLLGLGVSWWAQRIDQTALNQVTPELFAARGIVPIGYAAFAFMLGVTAGMILRRTVPAMAATLVIYIAAVVSMPLWIRAHLVPASHVTRPLDPTMITGIGITNSGMTVIGDDADVGGWVMSSQTITSAGQPFTGPADSPYCGEASAPSACLEWLGTLHLRQDITHHPASHFWPLQWTEAGIFLAIAALLTGFCFWWTRRRLT